MSTAPGGPDDAFKLATSGTSCHSSLFHPASRYFSAVTTETLSFGPGLDKSASRTHPAHHHYDPIAHIPMYRHSDMVRVRMVVWECEGVLEAFLRRVMVWGLDGENEKTRGIRNVLQKDLVEGAVRDVHYPAHGEEHARSERCHRHQH